jgi:DNA replication and repair protein RecF
MKLLAFDHISITQFKNYSDSQFSFGPRFNLISGLNGMGKTNLLDAIYYLSTGKSYFTPYDQRVVRQGTSFFRLTGSVQRDTKRHSIIIKVIPGDAKEIVVDQVAVNRISEHVGFIPIVFSAPRDIELVTGSSQARRRYVDHLLCQVDQHYLQALVAYNSLLQQRNAALKSNMPDLRRMLQTYDDQLHPLAQYVFEKRQGLQDTMTPLLHTFYAILSDDRENVDCRYESQLAAYPYQVLADKHLDLDIHTQRTNAGIHKDDFAFAIKSMPAKEYGSQGQIKSLIFSMHLAKHQILQEHTGLPPVMILDDVFDKLDERRLARLLEILSAGNSQVFISDTDPERLSRHLPAALIHSIILH